MKRCLTILVPLLFCVTFFFGQELSQITPPSPSAFELTRYGDIQINESRGKLTHTIPLYTFTSGSLELPITFSYFGDGVKVDQLSSWTGINWVLNAGGVITRTVRDKPDEVGNRFLYSFNDLETMTQTINGIRDINLLESSGLYDTQVDHFLFSFGPYSGSFFLDQYMQPQLATYDTELKIEFLGGAQNVSNQVIVITDPQGVQYYFGGSGGTEQTRLDFTNNSSGGALPTTAYYLYKIVNPANDIINLIYETELNPYNIKLSKSQSVTGTRVFDVTYTSFNGTVYNKIYNGRYLSRITSNRSDIEIHLHSTGVVNYNYNRILNELKIVKSSNSGFEDFKKFGLVYVSKNSLPNSTRFFLEKINFINSQDVKEYDYHFEYNSFASLPDRLSSSKDYYGYYNGVSNSSDLPTNNHPYLKSVPGFVLGNREPDFNYAVLGALTKIYYPTGGFTNVIYEGAQIKKDLNQTCNLSVYCNLSQMNPEAYPIPDTQLLKTIVIDEGISTLSLPSEDQEVVFNIDAIAQGSLNNKYKIHVKVENIYNLSAPVQIQSFKMEYEMYTYAKTFTFNFLKDNSYIITLELELPPGTPNPASVDVDLNFKYASGFEVVNGAGVRVKRITDNPVVGSPITKRYYYQKMKDVNDISKIPYGYSSSTGFIDGYVGNSVVQSANGYVDVPTSVATLRSDPIYSNFFSNGPFYKDVTISYGGDSFENGGVQKEFKYNGESTGINFLPAIGLENLDLSVSSITETQTENGDVFDGRLLKESIFKRDNGSLFMIKSIENTYVQDMNVFETNMAIKRIYDKAMQLSTDILDGLHMGLYKTYINKFNIMAQVTKDYIVHVPILDLDNADNYEHISLRKEFEYDNYVAIPKKTVTSTSNNNQIVESISLYPDDVSSNSSLGYDELAAPEFEAIKRMQRASASNPTGLHQLATVVQTENTIKNTNDEILSHSVQRTNFWEPHANLVLPKDVQVLKGTYNPNNPDKNILEDRVIYHGYYPNGNVKEVSKADGAKIVYIWGYKDQHPIAKIENASFTDIPTAVFNSIVAASNSDTNNTTEEMFRGELAKLRNINVCPNLTEALITTYTYDPLIGVTSVTDTKGYTVYYGYDDGQRLERVTDGSGHVLDHYDYYYKYQ